MKLYLCIAKNTCKPQSPAVHYNLHLRQLYSTSFYDFLFTKTIFKTIKFNSQILKQK